MSKFRCQWAGALAAVGGLVWMGWAIVLGVTGTETTLVRGAVVVSTLGVIAGHYAVETFYGARMKRPGVGGTWLGFLGGVVFALGQGLRIVTDWGTLLVALGVLALVGGSLLTAAGLVRTRIQPPWLGVLLALGTLGFLGFSVQPGTAVLYGLAWVALGQDLYRYDPPDGRFGEAQADYGWLP